MGNRRDVLESISLVLLQQHDISIREYEQIMEEIDQKARREFQRELEERS
ncbi:MAG: hypothetical protein M3297_10725 [Thermoproteota archaeon]|nr:hypothetical protein [Thermoproteota archaeon]